MILQKIIHYITIDESINAKADKGSFSGLFIHLEVDKMTIKWTLISLSIFHSSISKNGKFFLKKGKMEKFYY